MIAVDGQKRIFIIEDRRWCTGGTGVGITTFGVPLLQLAGGVINGGGGTIATIRMIAESRSYLLTVNQHPWHHAIT
eukprot:333296-Pyramimonas_sp.AAC.1